MTAFDLDKRQIVSSIGGEHAAYKRIVEHLNQQAGASFVRGRDEEAVTLRMLAKDIGKWQDDAARRLHEAHKDLADAR